MLAIKSQNVAKFELLTNLLKQFYARHDSPLRLKILGLNLLRLLAQVKISEFHVELMGIDKNDLKNNLIKFAIKIEQCLMEGSYNRIFKDQVPCKIKN